MSHRKIIPGYTRVGERVGKTRITIWRDVKAGTFPAPIELGPNSVGWYEDEIDDWLASRPRRTYGTERPAEAEAGIATTEVVP